MGSPLPASAPGINGLAPAHICAGTEWARSRHVDTGTKWARHRRICAETGLTPPTPTPGTDWARHAHVVRLALRLPRPHSHQDRAHHSPRLRRDRACPAHICTGTDGLCRSARPPSRRSSRTPASRPSRSCHRMCACGLSSRACARRSACVCMCACVCALASASLYLHACTLRRARASVRACACGSAAGSHRAEGAERHRHGIRSGRAQRSAAVGNRVVSPLCCRWRRRRAAAKARARRSGRSTAVTP
jgi:hypothetical protein